MTGVSFAHVRKTFGDVDAVHDLTFEVDPGEFLVLVGPSGCGKTTALRMVAGLEDATSGEIRIGDRVVNDIPPRDRDIAMVFQSYALYPHMSVFDNLAFGLRQRKVSAEAIRDAVNETAGMLAIEQLLDRKPKELSGGQRQRVALGRAIVRRPQVFLMDEPLSNLDAHLRLRTRAEIVALHRRLQTTVLYVTHDQVEAMTMGSRIAVLNAGSLQQLDTPQHLYDRPRNTFVATFIGSPSMNLLAGELSFPDAVPTFVNPLLTLPLLRETVPARVPSDSVTIGVRPEHMRLATDPDAIGTLTGEVTLVEPLGSDLFVTLEAGGSSIVARLAPNLVVHPGECLSLRPDPEAVHLFDTRSGERLT